MNHNTSRLPSPRESLHLLAKHWRLWTIPALVVSAATLTYAMLRPNTWEAVQTLVVRNEAANNDRGPGKFGQVEEMKTVQETILELVRSRSVLEAAMKSAGPPSNCKALESWPSARDIDDFRSEVKLVPPKGAEFGKTEVFYLAVRDRDRSRALALNKAICEQLQTRFQQLRDAKAQSMVAELTKTVSLAMADLAESTAQLTATEKQIGGDLAELRAMQEVGSGDSALRRSGEEIRSQLRETKSQQQSREELLTVLRAAKDDPGRLLATPNRLLESQPAIKQLKEGLVATQLRTAELQGLRSEEHPLVKSSRQAEEQVGRHLHDELTLAIRGLEVELRMDADRIKLLDEQLAEATARQERLAAIRATYEAQAAENRHRTQLVDRAEQNLAEARASHAGANAASLIGSIDLPDTGSQPVGPGRTIIALGGIVGGLIAGLGVFFLAVPQNRRDDTAEEEFYHSPRISQPVEEHSAANGSRRNGDRRMNLTEALQRLHRNRMG
jgi:polysaccharide biosynthesis transport protein